MRARLGFAFGLMLPAVVLANEPQVIQLNSSQPAAVRPQIATAGITAQPQAQAQAPASSGSERTLEQRVATLERMMEARNHVQLNVQQQLDQMQFELSELIGTSEEHAYQLQQILNRQRELYRDIESRLAAAPASPSESTASTSPVQQPVAAESSSAEENAAYQSALSLALKEKRYAEATVAFRDFLVRYPKSAHAANAYYWLGQLLWTERNLDEARSSFQSVVSLYPDSNKRPDALLKLGLIAQRQGESSKARQLFEQVMSDYPGSSSAKLAQKELTKG